MFIKAVCDEHECLVNTDYIIEVYDLNKSQVRAYTMEMNYPYFIDSDVWNKFLIDDRLKG